MEPEALLPESEKEGLVVRASNTMPLTDGVTEMEFVTPLTRILCYSVLRNFDS